MKTKVLIVKHDTKSLEELKVILGRRNDIEVVAIVNDGYIAVNTIKKYNPHVILIDLLLPNMDGMAVMDEVNKLGDKGYKFIVNANSSQIRFMENAYKGKLGNIFVNIIDDSIPDIDIVKEIINTNHSKLKDVYVYKKDNEGFYSQNELMRTPD